MMLSRKARAILDLRRIGWSEREIGRLFKMNPLQVARVHERAMSLIEDGRASIINPVGRELDDALSKSVEREGGTS